MKNREKFDNTPYITMMGWTTSDEKPKRGYIEVEVPDNCKECMFNKKYVGISVGSCYFAKYKKESTFVGYEQERRPDCPIKEESK